MRQAYCHNSVSVSSQTVDDEVILIHFDTGHYFSLRGAAAELWCALAEPVDAAMLASMFREGAPVDAVQRFLDSLLADGLLIEVPASAATRTLPLSDCAFTLPEIERHTDLEAILMADPIHEVEDQGWPNTLKA